MLHCYFQRVITPVLEWKSGVKLIGVKCTPIKSKLYSQGPCKRTQHRLATTANMLRSFAHPVACCCVLLREIWNWSNFWANSSQHFFCFVHAETQHNNVASLAQLLQHCWGHACALHMVSMEIHNCASYYSTCTRGIFVRIKTYRKISKQSYDI